MSNRIAVACDHAGYLYKNLIIELLRERGLEVADYGVDSADSADYPDYAAKAAEAVSGGEVDRAVIVCGSGIGVSIVANKFAGVRAANCVSEEMARLAREHNDANVLTIGERIVDREALAAILDAFLNTPASDNPRHQRRVEKIHSVTGR